MNPLKDGAKMININEIEENMDGKSFCFILHKLDEVIVGINDKTNYDILKKAIKENNILELHTFNNIKEIFYSKEGNELISYKPMLHGTGEDVIERKYLLEKKFLTKDYNIIVTKEYIKYDHTCMAYIDKVVLYNLEKEENINE